MRANLTDLRYLMKAGASHDEAYHALSVSDNLEEAMEVLGIESRNIKLGLKTNQIVTYSFGDGNKKFGKIVAISSRRKPLFVAAKRISDNYKLLPSSIIIEFEEDGEKHIDYLNKRVHVVHPSRSLGVFPIKAATENEKMFYRKLKKERMKKWITREFRR